MQREKAKAILLRIAETLTRGPFMAIPQKLFVFGSFARGAMEPNDLDLLLLYTFPEDHRERLYAVKKNFTSIPQMLRDHPETRYMAEFRKRLRKPGEKMDLMVHHPREPYIISLFEGQQNIKPDDLRLVWRKGDKTAWRGRIEGLQPDPDAGSMARNHLFPFKRLAGGDGLPFMEFAMIMIEHRLLRFRHIPLEAVPVKLGRKHRDFIDFMTRGVHPIARRDSALLLPYLCGWADMHGQRLRSLSRHLEAWSSTFTHRAHLGRPSLRSMVRAFIDREKLERQALIPHIKKGEPNGILEFERGKRWNSEAAAEMIAIAARGVSPQPTSQFALEWPGA